MLRGPGPDLANIVHKCQEIRVARVQVAVTWSVMAESSSVPRVPYIGRFAPSPTGPLHLGSLVAAVASYLDARAHRGTWLVRIEDVDTSRSVVGASEAILEALEVFGMRWDASPLIQSQRGAHYDRALARLKATGQVFPCACTRREIADTGQPGADGGPVYPGTCRNGIASGQVPRSWRLRVSDRVETVNDRHAGPIEQNLAREVGDFILKRADGPWAYQLAVVIDDAAQGVTDVVRGSDLLLSTPRQAFLQRCLGYPAPRYLHVPVVTDAHGIKLSKQTGAKALDLARPIDALESAARHLGLGPIGAADLAEFWEQASVRWSERHCIAEPPLR